MSGKAQPEGNQRQVVESAADQILLVAPPGCGKTEVLAMRAERLVREGAIRPGHRLLAVTYSKRARDNMSQRLQARLGYQLFRRFVTVQNFHGLAGRVIRAHGATLGIEDSVVLPTRRWLADTLSTFTDDWPAKGRAESTLRILKSQPISDEDLGRLVADSGNDIAARVEAARSAENRMDYPDLLRHAQRLLRVPGVARLYQEHFDALVVDEFQDLSLQQLDIVSRTCVRNALYVGDPMQGIYSWAGAQPTEVENVLVARCTERIELTTSFRSSPEVLALVNAVGVPLGAAPLTAADPESWGDRGRSRASVFATDVEEAAGVARLASGLFSKNPKESIGVISRSGFRRKQIDIAFSRVDLPIQYWDLALDTPGLLAVLKGAARGIRSDRPIADQLSTLHRKALEAVGDDDVDTINEIDDALIVLTARSNEGDSVREVLSRVREVGLTEEVPQGVHLLNAHVGKGQQFDWVIVVGLEDGHVPDFRSKEDPEEQRVLMVMLSRAKRGLIVSRASRTTTKYGMRNQIPSPWWPLLESAAQPGNQPPE